MIARLAISPQALIDLGRVSLPRGDFSGRVTCCESDAGVD